MPNLIGHLGMAGIIVGFMGLIFTTRAFGASCISCTNSITGACTTTGPNCCAPCTSGGTITPTSCPDDCPSTSFFSQVSGTNYEAKCVDSTFSGKICKYQCIDGYFNYNGGVGNLNGTPTCYKCPTANVQSCTRTKLTCKSGYFHFTRSHNCVACVENVHGWRKF